MTFFKKFALSIGLACTALTSATIIASAATNSGTSGSSYYSLGNSWTYIDQTGNPFASSAKISCNTRPQSGTGGIRVGICDSTGNAYTSKTFPYYTSTTDLSFTMAAGQTAYFYGESVTGTVSGTLYYYWS